MDGDPGFNNQAFSALKDRVEKNKKEQKPTIVSAMFDEITIKKHVEYADGKFHGYVDVGTGVFDDCAPPATHALVIMAVSVNEGYKIPLGYFLIVGMSGEERANLVRETFKRLHETGVNAVSFTCDGPSCHLSMMKELGADVTAANMESSILDPADPSLKVNRTNHQYFRMNKSELTIGQLFYFSMN